MEKLILNYLDKNYAMKLSTFSSYIIYNKKLDTDETLKYVMKLMTGVFSTSEDIIYAAFEKWCDKETVLINNRIVEMQEKLYQETGQTLPFDISEINKYLLGY